MSGITWNERQDRFIMTARGYGNSFADIAAVLSMTEGQRVSAKAAAARHAELNPAKRSKK